MTENNFIVTRRSNSLYENRKPESIRNKAHHLEIHSDMSFPGNELMKNERKIKG